MTKEKLKICGTEKKKNKKIRIFSDKMQNKQHIFYLLVFITGVLCSILAMLFMVYYMPDSLSRKRKHVNYLSDEHFLQVRDDYSIYYPSSEDSDEPNEAVIERSEPEGTF